MIWIAIVLCIFLFYQFVEKKHKIIVFKLLAALIVLSGASYSFYWTYNWWSARTKAGGMTVEFSSKDLTDLNKEAKALLIDQVFETVSPLLFNYFQLHSRDELQKVKSKLFERHLDLPRNDEDWDFLKDENIDVLFAYFANKESQDNLKALRKEEEKAVHANLDVKVDQDKNEEMTRFNRSARLFRIWNAFVLDDMKQTFLRSLTQRDVTLLGQYQELRSFAFGKLNEKINASPNIKTKIALLVCNNLGRPLENYSFNISGLESGRSSAHSIVRDEYDSGLTHLTSDIIVDPHKCVDVEWSGNYKFYDHYEIKEITSNWKN